METMDKVALTLVIIGALNWLLVGIANIDFVASLFGGSTTMLSRIIYIVIGLAGLWAIRLFTRPQITSEEN